MRRSCATDARDMRIRCRGQTRVRTERGGRVARALQYGRGQPGFKLGLDARRTRRPVVGIGRKQLKNHRLKGGVDADPGRPRCKRGRWRLEFRHDNGHRIPLEGEGPGQGSVGDRPERVQVGPSIEVRLPFGLFRSDKGRSSEKQARFGTGPLSPRENFGQTKVEKTCCLVSTSEALDEDIARFDVSMDDPGRVGFGEGAADVNQDSDNAPCRKWSLFGDGFFKGDARKKLRYEVGTSPGADAKGQRPKDSRVLQAGEEACLGPKAFFEVGYHGQPPTEDLDRDRLFELMVLRYEHCARRALGQESADNKAVFEYATQPLFQTGGRGPEGRGRVRVEIGHDRRQLGAV